MTNMTGEGPLGVVVDELTHKFPTVPLDVIVAAVERELPTVHGRLEDAVPFLTAKVASRDLSELQPYL